MIFYFISVCELTFIVLNEGDDPHFHMSQPVHLHR
jgi:hypothetical protein